MTGIIITLLVTGIGAVTTGVISALIVFVVSFRIKQKLNGQADLPDYGWDSRKAFKFLNSSDENENEEIASMKAIARKLVYIFAFTTLLGFLCFASIGFILLFD